jgi:hypothetical protein
MRGSRFAACGAGILFFAISGILWYDILAMEPSELPAIEEARLKIRRLADWL